MRSSHGPFWMAWNLCLRQTSPTLKCSQPDEKTSSSLFLCSSAGPSRCLLLGCPNDLFSPGLLGGGVELVKEGR